MGTTRHKQLAAAVLACGLVGASAVRAEEMPDSTYTPTPNNDVNYGLYLGMAGGVSLAQPMSVQEHDPLSATAINRTVGHDTGFNVTGSVGVKWRIGLRTEAEFSYRENDLSHLDTTALTGSQQVFSAMGNALYDINIGSFIVSLGGGAGVGRNKWNDVTGFATPHFDSHDTTLQWQAIGEVALPISTHLVAFAGYHYITLENSTFLSTTGAASIRGSDHSHNIMAGLRYFFNPAG